MTVHRGIAHRPRLPAIVLADDTDSAAVRALIADSGYDYLLDLDWTRVAPWWLLAILRDQPVGCIQMGASLPIGRLEYLCISRRLGHADRARTAYQLMHFGMAYLRQTGCSMVQGIVGAPYEGWVSRLVRRGGVVVVSGDMVARRLR